MESECYRGDMKPAAMTPQNFEKGMLIDHEWMGGISRESEGFSVFVVDHASGSVVAQQTFPMLDAAIDALNRIPRDWKYESTGGCSGDRCAEGKCKGTGCKIFVGPADSGAGACG